MRATPVGPKRAIAALAVLCGIAMVAIAADHPRSSRPVRIDVSVRSAVLRVRDGVPFVRVRLRCSEDTVAEIDSVLEQRQRSGMQRAVRIVDVPCFRQPFSVGLAFEGARFDVGHANLSIDAMAGFAEQFGETHVHAVEMLAHAHH